MNIGNEVIKALDSVSAPNDGLVEQYGSCIGFRCKSYQSVVVALVSLAQLDPGMAELLAEGVSFKDVKNGVMAFWPSIDYPMELAA